MDCKPTFLAGLGFLNKLNLPFEYHKRNAIRLALKQSYFKMRNFITIPSTTHFVIKFSHIRITMKPDSPYSKLNDKQVFETLISSNIIQGRGPSQCSYQSVAPLLQNEAFVANKYIYLYTELTEITSSLGVRENGICSSLCHQLDQLTDFF